MYRLRHFNGPRFDRINAVIDSLEGHVTSYLNLVGSATLPLPQVCEIGSVPGSACRVEGFRGSRYFPATEPMDQAEIVIEEATRRLFKLDDSYEVNAQPHSATQANHAAFRAVLSQSEGPVTGLSAADGGHISHQFGVPPLNRFVAATESAEGLDYDGLARSVQSIRPAMIVAGGSSYTRAFDFERLREIADSVGCHLHADLAHTAPFVASGVHSPAFPLVDSATIDPSKNLRGSGGGILIYRRKASKAMRRALFPIEQSAPNQNGLLAKAVCLSYWTDEELSRYARRMVRHARILGDQIALVLGAPIYGGTDSHLLLFDATARCGGGREAEEILERVRVLANRNQLPRDSRTALAVGLTPQLDCPSDP